MRKAQYPNDKSNLRLVIESSVKMTLIIVPSQIVSISNEFQRTYKFSQIKTHNDKYSHRHIELWCGFGRKTHAVMILVISFAKNNK